MEKCVKVLKKILGCLLAVSLILNMSGVSTLSVEAAAVHSHPVCGKTHTDIGDHEGECSDISWTAWSGDNVGYCYNGDWMLESGNYYLTRDISVDPDMFEDCESDLNINTLYAKGNVNICLNGYTLKCASIYVLKNSEFTICDCSDAQTGKINGRTTTVRSGADNTTINFFGGTISSELYSGVDISSYELQTFNMYGGLITGCTPAYDLTKVSGVNVYKGIFNMYGGEISGNTGYSTVWISGGATFNMKGGRIIDNSNLVTYLIGYSVYVKDGNSVFNMSGGTIESNDGFGVLMTSGTFNLSGGSIVDNRYGGIWINGDEFYLSGNPVVKDNMYKSTRTMPAQQQGFWLEKGETITLTEPLSHTTPIGVTMTKVGDFTVGWDTYMQGAEISDYFFSDKTNYVVAQNAETRELMLDKHSYVYTGEGAVITETCANGCTHKATATIEGPQTNFSYTGEAHEGAWLVYSEDTQELDAWQGGELELVYENNTEPGDAVVKTTITGADGNTAEAVKTFRIEKVVPYITELPVAAGITYGETISTSVLEGGSAQFSRENATEVEGSFCWEETAALMKPSCSDSNITDYNVVFVPADTSIYADSIATVKIMVDKAVADSPEPETVKYTYAQGTDGATADIEGMLPDDKGETAYSVQITDENGILQDVDVDENGLLTYDVKKQDSYTEGLDADITVRASMENYEDLEYTLTILITDMYELEEKEGFEASVSGTAELTYGQALEELELNSEEAEFVIKDTDTIVEGTLRWVNGEEAPEGGSQTVTWEFMPEEEDVYLPVYGNLDIFVNKATPVVAEAPVVEERVYNPEIGLEDTDLTGGKVTWNVAGEEVTVSGNFAWKVSEGNTTVPTVDNTGYEVVFTPDESVSTNYASIELMVEVPVTKAVPDIGVVSAESVIDTFDVSEVILNRTNETVPGNLTLNAEELEYGTNTCEWRFVPEDLINYTEAAGTVEITVEDTGVPSMLYRVGDEEYKKPENSTVINRFFRTVCEIGFCFEDALSGIDRAQYFISDAPVEDVSEINWTDIPVETSGEDLCYGITLSERGCYYIYVRAVDNAGRESIGFTEGIVVYDDVEVPATEADFVYQGGEDVNFNLALNGNTVREVRNGDTVLVKEQDYAVSEDGMLTIKAVYLDALRMEGEGYILNVSYNPLGFDYVEAEGNYAPKESSLTLHVKSPDGYLVETLEQSYFTGKAVKPVIRVYDGLNGNLLVGGKDYTVSYKNNKNAYTLTSVDEGFDARKAPAIIIKGKGNYSAQMTVYFTILPKDISDLADESIVVKELLTQVTGKVQKPAPVITFSGKKMAGVLKPADGSKPSKIKDFVYSYTDVTAGEGAPEAYKDAGTWTVLVEGTGNYTGSREVDLIIAEKGGKMTAAAVKKIPAKEFDGITPVVLDDSELVVTAKVNGVKTTLTKGVHYEVKYLNNDKIGNATVVITGIPENGFSGSKKVTFKIEGTSIKNAAVSGMEHVVYNGEEQTFELKVSLLQKQVIDGAEQIVEKVLTEDKDYTVTYAKNLNAGNGKVTIKGIGAYSGTVTKKFVIGKYDISGETDADGNVKVDSAFVETNGLLSMKNGQLSVKYVKGGAKPEVNLSFNGSALTAGKDYSVAYKNNKNVYTLKEGDAGYNASKAPAIIITGKGNFTGKITKTYVITARSLMDEEVAITLSVPDKAGNNKKGGYISKPVVKDSNGAVLKQGKDYSKPVYTIEKLSESEGALNIAKINAPEGYAVGTVLDSKDIVPVGTKIKVTIEGLSAYAGAEGEKISSTYTVTNTDFSKVKIAKITKEYTGKDVFLEEADFYNKDGSSKVTYGNGKNKVELKYGVDFEVVEGSYTKNRNKGTATVVLRGISEDCGLYGGNKTFKFSIGTRKLSDLFHWLW